MEILSTALRAALAASVLCAWLLQPSVAWAWDSEGHRIVALIAADGLTSAARVQVADLLGPDVRDAMETASTWADEIRARRPETQRWHFVDIEISAGGYDAARDCPAQDCVVAQIRKDERLVADGGLARPVRAQGWPDYRDCRARAALPGQAGDHPEVGCSARPPC